ncbi:MAG: hypothetical protein LBJ77_01980 [Holosporales bacterium]|jgi:hypothetical protein|nr:hypothetical protein [Holosporales bacterium]
MILQPMVIAKENIASLTFINRDPVQAKILVPLPSRGASIFWKYYLQNPKLIAQDKFFAGDISPEDIHLDLLIERMKNIMEQTGHLDQ